MLIVAESGWTMPDTLRAFLGVLCLCFIAWACVSNRRMIPWRVVLGGLGLQVVLGGLILGVPFTASVFEWIAPQVSTAIGMANEGSAFLFGPLACYSYTSDAADDLLCVVFGGRRFIKKQMRYIIHI